MTKVYGVTLPLVGMFLIAAHTTFAAGPSDAPEEIKTCVCALIPAGDSASVKSVAALLGDSLQSTASVKLVEREEIDTVLDEQTLNLALGAAGVSSRLKLGQLLSADLLIFIRERKSSDGESTALELSVAHSRTGLRIAVEMQKWDPNKAERVSESFRDRVLAARIAAGKSDLQVFAVPPFESRDLTSAGQAEKNGYARLVESALMQIPDIVVVEFAEAQLLMTEKSIRGDDVQRTVPFYVMGSFRSRNENATTKREITIKLMRGGKMVHKVHRADLAPDKVGDYLVEATAKCLEVVPNVSDVTSNLRPETDTLLTRGDVFAHIGEWGEAMPLFQTVLLLDSKNVKAHTRLMKGHIQCVRHAYFDRTDESFEYLKYRLNHAILALDHLQALFNQEAFTEEHKKMIHTFKSYFHTDRFYDKDADPLNIMPDYLAVRRRCLDLLLDYLSRSAPKGTMSDVLFSDSIHYSYNEAVRLADYDETLAVARRLHDIIDSASNASQERKGSSACLAITIGKNLSETDSNRAAYLAYIESLKNSDSACRQWGAQVATLYYEIRDQASYERSWKQMQDLMAKAEFHYQDRYTMQRWFEWRVLEFTQARSARKSLPTVPRFFPIDTTCKATDKRGRPISLSWKTYDWLDCGDAGEFMANERGLFRLKARDELVLVHRTLFRALWWDGEFIWAAEFNNRYLYVFNPQGEIVAKFDQPEVAHGHQRLGGLLQTLRPGQACWAAAANLGTNAPRSWVTLLTFVSEDGKRISPQAESILEARSRKANDVDEFRTFSVEWCIPLIDGNTAPTRVLLGRFSLPPLIIDCEKKTARPSTFHWPKHGYAIRHNELVFVGDGGIGSHTETSAVYWTDQVDQKLFTLADFGPRPSTVSYFGRPYFVSMVVLDGKLHLLTEGREAMVPAWVAIDLKTCEAYSIVETFWERARHPYGHMECLRTSSEYGIISILSYRAYHAQLPPSSSWPKVNVTFNTIPPDDSK